MAYASDVAAVQRWWVYATVLDVRHTLPNADYPILNTIFKPTHL